MPSNQEVKVKCAKCGEEHLSASLKCQKRKEVDHTLIEQTQPIPRLREKKQKVPRSREFPKMNKEQSTNNTNRTTFSFSTEEGKESREEEVRRIEGAKRKGEGEERSNQTQRALECLHSEVPHFRYGLSLVSYKNCHVIDHFSLEYFVAKANHLHSQNICMIVSPK